ncbi:MAG: TonB-dependent receptor, partial [Acidobacteriota bacterium]
MHSSKLLRIGIAAALALFGAGRLLADGTQTGLISGTVLDAAGNAVQGVEVLAAGPQIQRRGLTDAEGRFRFPALGVGSYRVSAELLGLTATAEMVAVHVSQSTDVQLQLREPGTAEPAPEVEEWIQVVAEAPIVDRFDNRVGATISLEFLDQLPVQRFYQSVTLLLPGVNGGEDGNPNVSGALRSSNLFLIDGVDTTDPTTGLFGLNLGFEAVDQVEVTTAAAPADYSRASGAVINVVTRSGGNEFSGVARVLASNNAWNDDYDYSDATVGHIRPQVDAANAGPDSVDSNLALALGGPILLDHLWFFGAFEDTTRSFLQPSEQQGLWNEDSQIDSTTFKLSWQVNPEHSVELQHNADSAVAVVFSPFSDNPAENRLPSGGPSVSGSRGIEPFPGDLFALQNSEQDGSFTKLQWNAVLNQRNSFSLTLAHQERELSLDGRNSSGLTSDAPHLAFDLEPFDGGAFVDRLVLFNGSVQEGVAERPRDQGSLAFNSFFSATGADHELQVGIDYQTTESQRNFQTPGAAGIDRATGMPVSGQLFLDLDFRDECFLFGRCESFDPATGIFQPFSYFNFLSRPTRTTDEDTFAIYASDTISWDRLVVTVGARYEATEAQDSLGGAVVDDDSIVPRVSLSWDPIGDNRTLLTAAWGRYTEPFLLAYVDTFEQRDALSGYVDYEWIGGDFCFGEDPSNLDSFCWEPVAIVPFFQVQ